MRNDRSTVYTLLILLALALAGIVFVVWTNHVVLDRQGAALTRQQQVTTELLGEQRQSQQLVEALQAQVRHLCAGRPNCSPVTLAPATPAPAPTRRSSAPAAPQQVPTSRPVTPRPTAVTSPAPRPTPTRTAPPRPSPSPSPTRSCLLKLGPICR